MAPLSQNWLLFKGHMTARAFKLRDSRLGTPLCLGDSHSLTLCYPENLNASLEVTRGTLRAALVCQEASARLVLCKIRSEVSML